MSEAYRKGYNSVCYDCKCCESEELSNNVTVISCIEGMLSFLNSEGCWRFEKRPEIHDPREDERFG